MNKLIKHHLYAQKSRFKIKSHLYTLLFYFIIKLHNINFVLEFISIREYQVLDMKNKNK